MSLFVSSYVSFSLKNKEIKCTESKEKDSFYSIKNYNTTGKIVRLVLNKLTFGFIVKTFDLEIDGKHLALDFSSLKNWLEKKSGSNEKKVTLSAGDSGDHAKIRNAIKSCLEKKLKND